MTFVYTPPPIVAPQIGLFASTTESGSSSEVEAAVRQDNIPP